MGTDLAERVCVPCRSNIPPLTSSQIAPLLEQLFGWQVDAGKKIHKAYPFDDFMGAVDFVNQVAEVAEEQGHHPDLFVRWGEVQVFLWTHKIEGLNEADFIMAAKIDRIFGTQAAMTRSTAGAASRSELAEYVVTGNGWTINPPHETRFPALVAGQIERPNAETDSVKAEVTWRQQGWMETKLSLELNDGTSWVAMDTFDKESPPPADLTEATYNVSAVLNTADKVDAAQFCWRGPSAGPPDGHEFTISVERIRLIVDGG